MSETPARAGRFELLAASLLTGILGAATIYASELRLGLEAFAPLAQLWTFWALFAASITFSVQHWVIRSVIAASDVRRTSRTLALTLVPIAVVVAVTGWLLSDSWFEGHSGFAVISGLLVLGTGINGYGRGHAAAHGPGRLLAVIIVGENLIRLALLVPLILLDAAAIWYGVALLAGFLINFVARPVPHRMRRSAGRGASAAPVGLVVTGTVGLISYATMFGGPLLLGPAGVEPAVISALFLVITLARIPFIVVLGLLPRVAVYLELIVAHDEAHELRRFVGRVSAGALCASLVVGSTALIAADRSVGRLLDTSDQFGGDVYALVGAASVLSLGSLVVSMALVAQQRNATLLVIWLVPLIAAGVGLVWGWFASVEGLAVWLIAIELVMLASLCATQVVRPRSGSV